MGGEQLGMTARRGGGGQFYHQEMTAWQGFILSVRDDSSAYV